VLERGRKTGRASDVGWLGSQRSERSWKLCCPATDKVKRCRRERGSERERRTRKEKGQMMEEKEKGKTDEVRIPKISGRGRWKGRLELGGKWGKPRKNAYDDVGSSADVIGFLGGQS
jgi:hypothetical protein